MPTLPLESRDPVFHIRDLNAQWRSVLHLGTRQKIPKGHLWDETHKSTSFSFLEKGRVRLLSFSGAGKERIVLYIYPGCIFRELLFMHVSPQHPASLMALEPCEVINFPRKLLHDTAFAAEHPELMLNMIHSLAAKAGAFFSQITETAELAPMAQVCRYLYRLYESRLAGDTTTAGCSQSELALLLGLHRSTVCRIISELRTQGVLGAFTRHHLEILDPQTLSHLCAEDY